MHPTARMLVYIAAALAVPRLATPHLALVLGLGLSLAWRRAVPVANLLWRARWLFLLLVVGGAYNLPGQAVWLSLGAFSPTWQGLAFGFSHALRLLCLFLLLDLLVLALPREPQLAGLHGLLRPLRVVGLDAGRATVRLGLTLGLMERPPGERLGLAGIFSGNHDFDDDRVEYRLPAIPWRGRDSLALLGMCAALVLLWRYA